MDEIKVGQVVYVSYLSSKPIRATVAEIVPFDGSDAYKLDDGTGDTRWFRRGELFSTHEECLKQSKKGN